MNEVKETLLRVLRDFCQSLYALRKESHAEFLLDAHEDNLQIARAIVGNGASPWDTGLADSLADAKGLTRMEWALATLEENHAYVTARLQLAGLYTTAAEAIVGAAEGTELQVAAGVFAQAQGQVSGLAGEDPAVQAWLGVELQRMAVKFGLAPAPEEEVVETVYAEGVKTPEEWAALDAAAAEDGTI